MFSKTQTLDLSKHTIDEQVLRVMSDSYPLYRVFEYMKRGNLVTSCEMHFIEISSSLRGLKVGTQTFKISLVMSHAGSL